MLRARGALVIDADHVGHQVLQRGGEAFLRVIDTWPDVLVGGEIDRQRLADIVFRDRRELEKLEAITHPAIRERIHRLIDQAQQEVVVVEVPLLSDFMGPGWKRVVVDADPDARLSRLRKRGMRESDAASRMHTQPTPDEWQQAAELVIDNSGDEERLDNEVERVWTVLTHGESDPRKPAT